MGSKRVILIALAAIVSAIVVGTVSLALYVVQVRTQPFDAGVVTVDAPAVSDWTLPEGTEYVSLLEHKGRTLLIKLRYKGITIDLTGLVQIEGDYVSTMEVQMAALARRVDHTMILGPDSPWTPVRPRQRISIMNREGFANRGLRTIVCLYGDNVDAYIWNAGRDASQSLLMHSKNDDELRVFLEFVESWRVRDFDSGSDPRAEWEKFVARVSGT